MPSDSAASVPGVREKLREPVHNLLTDHLMMVLALLLIPTTILPFFFTFSPFILALFEVLNYIIIAIFAVEYFGGYQSSLKPLVIFFTSPLVFHVR